VTERRDEQLTHEQIAALRAEAKILTEAAVRAANAAMRRRAERAAREAARRAAARAKGRTPPPSDSRSNP
jgi:hypothetical protein